MKKILLLTAIVAIAISCKKEKAVQPQTTPSPQQTWNGLYCISFIKWNYPGPTYDTLGKMCGDNSDMNYYNSNNPYPNPYQNADSHTGKKIFNCNECK